jgi:CDP-4-dehydro-6-deoxyglucose reductase, E3
LSSNTEQKFEIVHIKRYGEDKASFTLNPLAPFSYLAGQYLELSFADIPHRPYSIASAPSHDGSFDVHIKDSGNGAGISHYAIHKAVIGEIVHGRGPMGACVYEPFEGDIVLLAGGIGITHVKAIAEAAIAQKHPHPLHLYWSVKSVDDLYLQSYFFELKNKNNVLIYNDIIEDEISIGGSNFWSKGGVKDPSKALYYLSGPPAMIERIVPALIDLKVPEGHIKSDMSDFVQKAINKTKASLF